MYILFIAPAVSMALLFAIQFVSEFKKDTNL